jgi:hypothetical protein
MLLKAQQQGQSPHQRAHPAQTNRPNLPLQTVSLMQEQQQMLLLTRTVANQQHMRSGPQQQQQMSQLLKTAQLKEL